jgi:hypothetical protein
MRFLFIGSRFMLHASFPRSLTLTQLRFTLLNMTSSQQDLHPQVCAHAGRTMKKTRQGGFFIRGLDQQVRASRDRSQANGRNTRLGDLCVFG